MQFEMVRLSLVQRPQPDAFEHRDIDGRPFTRESWLRDVFGRETQFEHRGELFYYAPEDSGATGIIIGRIGRQIEVAENEPPEGHLAPTHRAAWKAAMVLIDPTHHADGQKAAIERSPVIGQPVSIFASLAAQISAQAEPFVIEVNAIVPSEAFWDFVKANEGMITSVQFELVAPNMFGEADDYDREMREMQQQEKAQKVKLAIESKDGFNLNTVRVRRAADYANKGAGSTTAKTKTGKRYNSKDKARKVSISNKDIQHVDQKGLIYELINVIFGQS